MNRWIISFLELSETKMIQNVSSKKEMIHQFVWKKYDPKMQVPKRNDPPICVISLLELTFLDYFLHKMVDQYGALYLHYVLLLLPVGSSRVCMDGPGNHGSFC